MTIFSDGVAPNSAPNMVTGVPTGPLLGSNPPTSGGRSTTKSELPVATTPADSTVNGPLVAASGTTTSIVVYEEEFTVAISPLNFTIGATGKPEPTIVTVAPTGAL